MSLSSLVVLESGKAYLINNHASIGKSVDNDIVLNDPAISDYHAMIMMKEGGWFVSCCSTHNIVELNGTPIPSTGMASLGESSKLKLGNTELLFSEISDDSAAVSGEHRNESIQSARPAADTETTKNHRPRRLHRPVIIAVILVTIVILSLLAGCLINHANGIKRMEEGDGSGAYSSFERDFLFSKNELPEAAVLAGEEQIVLGNYREAIRFFNVSLGEGAGRLSDALENRAKTEMAILNKLDQGEYYQASFDILDSIEQNTTGLSLEQWRSSLDVVVGKTVFRSDIDGMLNNEAAKKNLSDRSDFSDANTIAAFKDAAPSGAMVGEYYSFQSYGGDYLVISDAEDLFRQCGLSPAGKILILAQRHSYPEKAVTSAVLLNLMNLLPVDYYPTSLAEVEFIVLVTYDYEEAGHYIKESTVGLKENALIEIIHLPEKDQIYYPVTLEGDDPPLFITYYGTPPEWESGNAPNVGDKLYWAIRAIFLYTGRY